MAERREQKKGFIYRMVMGKERDEDYARSTLPGNRWELFWDILKGRVGKLCIVNLLMLLFFLPLAAVLVFWFIGKNGIGATLPFMGNSGVGYPNNLDVGLDFVQQSAQMNNMFALLCIPASLIAAIGLAGGFYVIRNMVWTEGTFIANDFWRGIRLNIGQMLFITAVLSVVIFCGVINFSMLSVMDYSGQTSFWTVAAHVATWIMILFVTMMCLHMITMSVTYKLKIWQLIKNSFILTIGLLFQNVFFIVLGISPLLVGLLLLLIPMMSSFVLAILVIVYLLIGLSIFVLAWTNYSQWVYDKFINDRVEGAVKNRGIYAKVKDGEEMERRKKAQAARFSNPKKKQRAVKPVTDVEVELTDLSAQGFTRANLQKLAEEKEQMKEDADKYAEEAEKNGGVLPEEEPYEADLDDDMAFEGYEEAMRLEGYEGEDLAELLEGDGDEAEDEEAEASVEAGTETAEETETATEESLKEAPKASEPAAEEPQRAVNKPPKKNIPPNKTGGKKRKK